MQRLRNSLALRLTVWFLLLSFLPLAVMTIFVRRNVADAFVELEAHYHGNQARALAAATSLLGDGEGDAAQALLAATIDGHHAVFIVDENGAYVAHSDEDKVAGSAYDDFSTGVVEQFLIGGDGTMVEAETGRVIGYSVVPGHGASEDQSVAVVVTNRPAMSAWTLCSCRSSTIWNGSPSFSSPSVWPSSPSSVERRYGPWLAAPSGS